ncbi:O-methyltransferase [Paraburkholderia flava]|uniref:O-methyltransferase n=1 Tax=Paraburkholderia flava TaxID=2547393 RepID=UPI00105F40BA|nr:class I SAM-dependent methyltransferase [Paraburkholderia flava]
MDTEAIQKFLREERAIAGPSPLQDARVNAVIERICASQRYPADGGPRANPDCDPADYVDYGFSITPAQGDLIYLLCRALRATRVVEFATSVGFSTLYFAAAVRDNGGGTVIGSELVPQKVATARRHLAEAGLADYAEIREGDGRATLKNLGGPVDFVLIDGWPLASGPSLAREVAEIVAPQLRPGGFMMNDNGEPDYIEFVRDPANGFLSTCLPIKTSTMLSVKLA